MFALARIMYIFHFEDEKGEFIVGELNSSKDLKDCMYDLHSLWKYVWTLWSRFGKIVTLS